MTPTESKFARASAVAKFLEAGNAFIPDRAVALFDPEGLVDETSTFPSGAHDDLVDATPQALAAMLLDRSGATAWLQWARKKAEAAASAKVAAAKEPHALPAAEGEVQSAVAEPAAAGTTAS